MFNKIRFLFNKSLPNWEKILDGKILNKKQNKKILIATFSGGHKVVSTIDSLVGVGLSLKGAHVSYLLCDQFLDNCIMKTHRTNVSIKKNDYQNSKLCDDCYKCGKIAFQNTNLDFLKLSSYFDHLHEEKIDKILKKNNTLKKILSFKINKIDIGEQVNASICRYYAVSNFTKEKNLSFVAKSYFKSALKAYFSIEKLLEYKKFDSIIVNHGFYIPQGIIAEIARKKKIDFVTWTTGARKNSIIFSHNNIYYKDFTSEPVSSWKNINLKKVRKKTINYLNSKVLGTKDYKYKDSKVDLDASSLFDENKIDLKKPLVGLSTNVIWDAQITYSDTIFKNMMEWVIQTIIYFKKRKDINLIIRVHPTEVNADRPAREKVADRINEFFKNKLPQNVFIVKPEVETSTYSILDKCSSILTYGTKLDIEYAARGFPVIIAGDAITRNKDLVFQPKNKKNYFKLLDQLPMIKNNKRNDALRFAYHYFFKRTISIKSLEEILNSFPPFKIKDNFIKQFKYDKNLNSICNSIIKKKFFWAIND